MFYTLTTLLEMVSIAQIDVSDVKTKQNKKNRTKTEKPNGSLGIIAWEKTTPMQLFPLDRTQPDGTFSK